MDNTERFLQVYKQLEAVIRQQYNLKNEEPIKQYLVKSRDWQHKYRLEYCHDVRNFLQHKIKVHKEFAIIPSDEMIEFLEETLKIFKQRPQPSDKAIKGGNLLTGQLTDQILPLMRKMNEKNYTNIPIISDGKVVGVFSEGSIFKFLLDEEIIEVEQSAVFSDLQRYTEIDNKSDQVFKFVRNDISFDELNDLFSDEFKVGKRLAMVFLTHSGKRSEKLIGILTPWDVLDNL